MAEKLRQYLRRLPDKLTIDTVYWDETELKKLDKTIDLYVATIKD